MINTPIVIPTVNGKCLPVLETSAGIYCPEAELLVHWIEPKSWGTNHNEMLPPIFAKYDSVILANDDIVLNPTSYKYLMEDVAQLKQVHGDKLGFVSACSDWARPSQNIRNNKGLPPLNDIKWAWEHSAHQVPVIAPLFCWMSKLAYNDLGKFPPINWYADDIACYDLTKKGYVHYVSRSYVHHVGSQTTGADNSKLSEDALSWVRANRPDFMRDWFGQ